MKINKISIIALFLISNYSHSDDLNTSYKEGEAQAKSLKSQGQGSLSSASPETTIPGYTSNPNETKYYGGVKGNSTSLDAEKQNVPNNNEVYNQVVTSQRSNPIPTISPNSNFIKTGTDAENNAESIAGKTSDGGSDCKDVTVNKSTFNNFTCHAQPYTESSCTRSASIGGHWEVIDRDEHYTINSDSIDKFQSGRYYISHLTGLPNGTITQVKFNYSFPRRHKHHKDRWLVRVSFANNTYFMYESSGSLTTGSGATINDGSLTLTYSNKGDGSGYKIASGEIHFTADLTIHTHSRKYIPEIVWSDDCGALKQSGGAISDSVCNDAGGERSVIVEGNTYTQKADCWSYQDTYVVGNNDSSGDCAEYSKNANCTVASHSCTDSAAGKCTEDTITYQCETKNSSMGKICGGQYFCQTGDCQDTQGNGDSGFAQSVSELAALASAADDVKGDSMTVHAFTGDPVSCRKAMAGFSDCCKNSGWGQSVALAHCNSQEKAIGKAKAKKIVVKIGTTCAKKVLGGCIQKKEVYCQFQGKLAKIIQEQGRKGQLGISFGSAKHPDCRGVTVDELQKINFDKIDYSDFYSELESKENLPNNQQTIDQIKAKINSQVNTMKGK